MECYWLFAHRIRGLLLAGTSPQAETDEGKTFRNELADRLLREGMGRYADEMLVPAGDRRQGRRERVPGDVHQGELPRRREEADSWPAACRHGHRLVLWSGH